MSEKPKNVFSKGLRIAHEYGIRRFIKDTSYYLNQRYLGHLEMILAYPKFKELSEAAITKDQALDFVFSFKRYGMSVYPFQVRKEISMFLSVAEKEKPRVVLEIGTGEGGTLFLLTRIATSNAIFVSVDLPSHPKWREKLFSSFSMKDQTLQFVRGNSHNTDTFNNVKQSLGENSVDLLFIDGDHKYDGAKMDFELYSQLVREGGLVAFHDIVPTDLHLDIEVPEFWNEIKNNYDYIEIIEEKNAKGIGILFLGSKKSSGREKVYGLGK
jgi:predicted O-methyltransferase YrrM